MKSIEQLDLWINNISAHNKETDECCPDFSCCRQDIITPRHIKLSFKTAYLEQDDNKINQMLMLFLGQLLKPDFNIETEFTKMGPGDIYYD
jgi:hypothetical protein